MAPTGIRIHRPLVMARIHHRRHQQPANPFTRNRILQRPSKDNRSQVRRIIQHKIMGFVAFRHFSSNCLATELEIFSGFLSDAEQFAKSESSIIAAEQCKWSASRTATSRSTATQSNAAAATAATSAATTTNAASCSAFKYRSAAN